VTTDINDACDLLCLDLPHAEQVRAMLAGPEQSQALAAQAKALGDPTRLRIAAALQLGEELCVCDMAWIVEVSENLASHHVRVLRNGGLATSRRDGKLVMYRLTEAGSRLLTALTGSPAPLAGAEHTPEATTR
jgi:DNA-binding transcriptional ArsR family regulator